jgi:carboxyl-terminal processing protease
MIIQHHKQTIQTFILIALLFFFTSTVKGQSNGFEVIKNLELIDLIHQNLEKYYVDEPKTGAISKAGIDAMLSELDPYTVYYHETNLEDLRMMSTGQYGGIGALIRKQGEYVMIAEPYEGNPAQKSGLRAGDKILEIDGKDMKGKRTDEVSSALKGLKGTSVTIKFDRPFVGEKEVTVERNEIKIPDVPYHGMLTENTGYLKLNSFTQTASKSVFDAFKALESEGMEKLIFDLRGNGGGQLNEAVNIVNFFVEKGQTVVQTKGRIPEENRTYKTRNRPLDLEIPVVVLIDGGSASASEIVAGSLQDLDRAVIIGSNSFGKGLVQRIIDLKYGAKMKLTISKYYTPSGRCIQRLDYYAENETNKIAEVPDSLLTTFKTKNGREVIDGRGIDPDVAIENDKMGRLTGTLLINNIIFNYATKYAHENKEIESAEDFILSDEEYNAFKKYVLEQDFDYSSRSEEKLKEMLEIAEKEGYSEFINNEYDQLMKKVKASKEKDLSLYKAQIKELLQNEIISRYYYQEGRILNAFQTDEDIEKALEILDNQEQYKKILGY